MTAPTTSGPETAHWLRRGILLVVGTMVYNAIEAGVAFWAGMRAGSIALVGFSLDSVIELAAAGVVLWRLRVEAAGAEPERVERTETRVHRFVGFTFLALAAFVTFEAGTRLWAREPAAESLIGIVLACASLAIMPAIAWGKFRVAERLGSGALRAEAKETLACAWLSLTLLIGLVANAVAGWWWADPVAALAMVPWLVREGREGLEGDHCD